MDGLKPPSKNFPFPFSQNDSIFESDLNKIFSASAATWGFRGRPNKGARTVLNINGAGKDKEQEKISPCGTLLPNLCEY